VSPLVCVDANIVVKWLLTEEDSPTALALAAKLRADDATVIAPPHMAIEVVNVIRVRVRRGELKPVEGEDLIDAFTELPIQIAAPNGLYRAAFELAQRYDRRTVYDTQYVALAQLAGCDFWTADMRLINALDGRIPFVRPLHTFAP
jgi:predicted nucleic acid-binding protein